MNTAQVITILQKIGSKIQEEKDYLTQLDNIIGDGDHGINLARGFTEVEGKLFDLKDKMPGEVLKNVGMILVSKVGGASGPLYGTGFMKAGMFLKEKETINMRDFIDAYKAAIEGIQIRGKSTRGEKTMLDAMIPAIEAMEESFSKENNVKVALKEGVRAAYEGVEFTKTIIATKGRASYLGERSLGHQDPGATSFCMILEVIAKEV